MSDTITLVQKRSIGRLASALREASDNDALGALADFALNPDAVNEFCDAVSWMVDNGYSEAASLGDVPPISTANASEAFEGKQS